LKAIFQIPEKKSQFNLDNFTFSQFTMIGEKPSNENYMLVEKFPIGEPIILITSNMPDDLLKEIKNMIAQYCNH
jgi:hypothetical protein